MTSVAAASPEKPVSDVPPGTSESRVRADRAPVLVPFVCPVCTAANGVQLIALSRKGGVECVGCQKWLRATDVMRAMHAPRKTA